MKWPYGFNGYIYSEKVIVKREDKKIYWKKRYKGEIAEIYTTVQKKKNLQTNDIY